MNKEFQLAQPIEKYLQTINAEDVERFTSTFADGAIVKDVEREFVGWTQ